MPRPATRSKNASQHPGHILLEGKVKRRTSEQKQADNARAEQERQEQTAARERGIERLAGIMGQAEEEEGSLLTNPPKPRPKPRILVKLASASKEMERPGNDLSPDEDMSGPMGEGELEEGLEVPQGEDEAAEGEGDQESDDEETPSQALSRRPRTQKMSSRNAVQAARGKLHQEVDGADSGDRVSVDSQKRKEQTSHNQASIKEDWAGVGEVKDWADKLASSKPLNTLLSQRSTSTSRCAGSISSSGSLIKGPRGTPVTASSTRTTTPSNVTTTELQDEERNSYIHDNDQVERNASSKVMASRRRTDTMDIIEIVSGSEEDDDIPPSPVPRSHPSFKKVAAATNAKSKPASTSEGKRSRKRGQHNQDDIGDSASQTGPPPSKRAKTAPHGTSGAQRFGSGVNNKYIKDDLPPGCTTDNVWRRLYISALAHFAAGYDNPWSIPSEKFMSTLQEIWDTVYGGNIEHVVTVGGPVFQIAKQSLNNWRGGFAAAAVAVITTLFANDVDFEDAAQRIEFAKAMLKKNCFLFSQNKGTDAKAWSGLWRSPLVLQTFAHHFNFIQGRVDVPTLDTELGGPRTALALSCAAVCRVLTLVSNDNISFEAAKLGNVWTAVISKGMRYEFNDAVWGSTTRRFLEPIKELSEEQFALVVEEAHKFVKTTAVPASSADSVEDDSEYEDLFAFR
ncbi:hypothetical protein HYDPIDRAFT_33813 [Hydnomerulius pinastri MD-312]|uniref:Unplaced genomic scaffold scaffold_76, whole genome shotgun sequence n=1 Tax=Hydnomerulius pinastri MD-312 TaxID=994086 RepID=A0A0C9VMD8_9AGAM|nr:hypothetical protein HYDPIDRAFT_33813 [Hydnomerulius pinastri MD-312]